MVNKDYQNSQCRGFVGPIPWGHRGSLCHALSLLSLLSMLLWHRCAGGVRQQRHLVNGNVKQAACGDSQWRMGLTFFKCFLFHRYCSRLICVYLRTCTQTSHRLSNSIIPRPIRSVKIKRVRRVARNQFCCHTLWTCHDKSSLESRVFVFDKCHYKVIFPSRGLIVYAVCPPKDVGAHTHITAVGRNPLINYRIYRRAGWQRG